MYCKNCGKTIDQDSKFCSYCGTSLLKTAVDIVIEPREHHTGIVLNKETTESKYDLSFKRNDNYTGVGCIFIFISLIFIVINKSSDYSIGEHETIALVGSIILFIVRCFVAAEASEYARKLNRKSGGWGILGFLFPAICLIIIGQLKKIKK